MPTYEFNIPISYVQQSDETFINKRNYLIKECVRFEDIDKSSLWNANKCANDDCYCNLFKRGDKLYLQFKSNELISHSIIELLNNSDDTPVVGNGGGPIFNLENGEDIDHNSYGNVIINTANTNSKCFYVKLRIYTCTPDPALLQTCIDLKLAEGKTQEQAEFECFEQFCSLEQKKIIFSEPYCEIGPCEQDTILIEGFYPKFDCNGNYYAPFIGGGVNSFKPSVRIRGEVTQTDYDFEETLINRKRIKSRQVRAYSFRTEKVPPYIVDLIAVCFNSMTLTIDGIEYQKAVKLSKNFDEGRMWILNTTLTRECDEIDFGCDA